MSAPTTFRFREIAGEPLSHPGKVSVKDSALIVIDVQNFYLPTGGWPVAGIETTNQTIAAVVERYRKVCLSLGSVPDDTTDISCQLPFSGRQ